MSAAVDNLGFWSSRARPIVGLLLCVSFILLHLFPLSAVFGGEADYNLIAGLVASFPLYNVADAVFVVLLVAHSFFTILSIYSSSIVATSFFSSGNIMYVMGKISALLIVPFFAYVMYLTRFHPGGTSGGVVDFNLISEAFSSSPIFGFLLIGFAVFGLYVVCALRLFLFQWGFLAGVRSKMFFGFLTSCTGFVLAMWGVLILFSFKI